jgi:ferredoxin-thioredoxin reductase catalytic subunit
MRSIATMNVEVTTDLIQGLLVNEKRFGYPACPCRLASGTKKDDLDITCPCDYRDPDLNEYGVCYCALYVSESVLKGEKEITPIPERRLSGQRRETQKPYAGSEALSSLSYPLWRCPVCGYLCARETPPEVCPICKARKERFERLL